MISKEDTVVSIENRMMGYLTSNVGLDLCRIGEYKYSGSTPTSVRPDLERVLGRHSTGLIGSIEKAVVEIVSHDDVIR
jgi:hypothetical protein